MRRVSVSRAALHRAGLRRVALPAAGWPCGARRGASGGGGDDNPYFPAGMPQELKDSIVLWYDLERQGATNESMAENPTLKDLSGNGNDATCYNFGWSGMSGIGGYNYSFKSVYKYKCTYTISENGNSITLNTITRGNNTELNSYVLYFFPFNAGFITGTYKVPAINMYIDNPKGYKLLFGLRYSTNLDNLTRFNDSRVISIPEQEVTVNNNQISIGLYFVDDITETVDANITLTLLPQYPDALVSDGVNDYCLVQDRYDDEGNLINKKSLVLNKEDGYTVIAKRNNLYQLNEKGIVASKHSGSTYGAFQIEYNFNNVDVYAYNFGTSNIIQISSSEIIYQTSKSYNGETSLNIGTRNDTSILDLFKYINHVFGKVALYSFLLFDRDLTDEEIQWVKNNLMQ